MGQIRLSRAVAAYHTALAVAPLDRAGGRSALVLAASDVGDALHRILLSALAYDGITMPDDQEHFIDLLWVHLAGEQPVDDGGGIWARTVFEALNDGEAKHDDVGGGRIFTTAVA
jgi:hypothetical protein